MDQSVQVEVMFVRLYVHHLAWRQDSAFSTHFVTAFPLVLITTVALQRHEPQHQTNIDDILRKRAAIKNPATWSNSATPAHLFALRSSELSLMKPTILTSRDASSLPPSVTARSLA